MITLALVAVTYAIALRLHISGPIAVVIAGVLIGNQGARFAMSDNTREHVFEFWDLIDELLNSVLLLLIGLEVLVIGWRPDQFGLALLAIPVVLIARFLSVAIPMSLLSRVSSFSKGAVAILTWGGLRWHFRGSRTFAPRNAVQGPDPCRDLPGRDLHDPGARADHAQARPGVLP